MSIEDEARRVLEQSKADARRSFDLATHPKHYVRVPDLADYVSVERRSIIRMIASGALVAVKVGRAWRVDTESARRAFHVQQRIPA